MLEKLGSSTILIWKYKYNRITLLDNLTINFAQERFLLELMFGIIIPNVSSGSGSDGQTRSDQFG